MHAKKPTIIAVMSSLSNRKGVVTTSPAQPSRQLTLPRPPKRRHGNHAHSRSGAPHIRIRTGIGTDVRTMGGRRGGQRRLY
jgi:hypothetical protein